MASNPNNCVGERGLIGAVAVQAVRDLDNREDPLRALDALAFWLDGDGQLYLAALGIAPGSGDEVLSLALRGGHNGKRIQIGKRR